MELAGHPTIELIQNHSEKLTKDGIDKFLQATPTIKEFTHALAK